ncbi:MAG: nucleotide exchange factor GrpE [Thermoplasmata archaeon]|nr:nucleotide exchange factor GrpE [Thermoplasmata archaeon]
MPDKAEETLSSDETEQAPNEEVHDREERETPTVKDKRVEELTDMVKRTQAEFENYKKRVEREWSEKSRLAGERVIVDLLAVLDTLDKAIESSQISANPRNEETGLEGVRRQLMHILQRAGLKEIDTEGQFDPFLHEALMREETAEGKDGQVLEVFQKGYMLGQKVIRAARVKVSVGPSDHATDVSRGGSNEDEILQNNDDHEGV